MEKFGINPTSDDVDLNVPVSSYIRRLWIVLGGLVDTSVNDRLIATFFVVALTI